MPTSATQRRRKREKKRAQRGRIFQGVDMVEGFGKKSLEEQSMA